MNVILTNKPATAFAASATLPTLPFTSFRQKNRRGRSSKPSPEHSTLKANPQDKPRFKLNPQSQSFVPNGLLQSSSTPRHQPISTLFLPHRPCARINLELQSVSVDHQSNRCSSSSSSHHDGCKSVASTALTNYSDWEDFDFDDDLFTDSDDDMSTTSAIRPYQIVAANRCMRSTPTCFIQVFDNLSEEMASLCLFRVSFDGVAGFVERRGVEMLDFLSALLEYESKCWVFYLEQCTSGIMTRISSVHIMHSINQLLSTTANLNPAADDSAPPTSRWPWQKVGQKEPVLDASPDETIPFNVVYFWGKFYVL